MEWTHASGSVSVVKDPKGIRVIPRFNSMFDVDINVNREVSVLQEAYVHLGQSRLIDKWSDCGRI